MSRVMVVLVLMALAGCAPPGDEAVREACGAGDAAACQAVAASDQRRAMAVAAGMQSMSNSFNQAAAQQTSTTCYRYSPYSVTCQSY